MRNSRILGVGALVLIGSLLVACSGSNPTPGSTSTPLKPTEAVSALLGVDQQKVIDAMGGNSPKAPRRVPGFVGLWPATGNCVGVQTCFLIAGMEPNVSGKPTLASLDTKALELGWSQVKVDSSWCVNLTDVSLKAASSSTPPRCSWKSKDGKTSLNAILVPTADKKNPVWVLASITLPN